MQNLLDNNNKLGELIGEVEPGTMTVTVEVNEAEILGARVTAVVALNSVVARLLAEPLITDD